MKKDEKGVGLVEVLLIVAVIGLILVVGWFLFEKQKDKTDTNDITKNTSQQTQTIQKAQEQYKRTTTIPANWKTYTSEKYKISLAYPPDWTVKEHVFTKKSGEETQNSFSKNATEILVICYQPKGLIQTCANQININNQPLAESLKELRRYNKEQSNGYRPSERSITFDGHEAVEFSTQDSKDYYVSANGNTYALPSIVSKEQPNGDGIESLTPENSLIMLESVKID